MPETISDIRQAYIDVRISRELYFDGDGVAAEDILIRDIEAWGASQGHQRITEKPIRFVFDPDARARQSATLRGLRLMDDDFADGSAKIRVFAWFRKREE